jgi:hypothetical protein
VLGWAVAGLLTLLCSQAGGGSMSSRKRSRCGEEEENVAVEEPHGIVGVV